jgi:hypothetical protein
MDRNDDTPQLGQERYMMFVRVTGVSHGSYSKSSELFYQCSVRVTGGSRYEIYAPQKSLGSQVVKICLNHKISRPYQLIVFNQTLTSHNINYVVDTLYAAVLYAT